MENTLRSPVTVRVSVGSRGKTEQVDQWRGGHINYGTPKCGGDGGVAGAASIVDYSKQLQLVNRTRDVTR